MRIEIQTKNIMYLFVVFYASGRRCPTMIRTRTILYIKYGNYIIYQDNDEGNEIHQEIHPYVNNLPVADTCFN